MILHKEDLNKDDSTPRQRELMARFAAASGRPALMAVRVSPVLLMMTIGVIAAIGPARQGLRIQPIEALRDE